MTDTLHREASYTRNPEYGIAELRQALEDAACIDIAQRNPGIDIGEVKAHREAHGDSWLAKDEPIEWTEHDQWNPASPTAAKVARAIDAYTSTHHNYVLSYEDRNAMATAIIKALGL